MISELQSRIWALSEPLPGSVPYDNYRPLNVPAGMAGGTVADFLAKRHPHLPADVWRRAAAAGDLLRRGQPVDLSSLVRAGDQMVHVVRDTVDPVVNLDIRILYMDASVLVVQKPAPLPPHPCGRFNRNSLSWLLEQACAPMGLTPRIVHRLDANTVGVMVLALTKAAATLLQAQFLDGVVQKTYLAEVVGNPDWNTCACTAGIGRETVLAGGRLIDPQGLSAHSRFRVLRRYGKTSLVAAMPITGRTNQLRAHLWHLGHAIVGDPFYLAGGNVADKQTLAVDEDPLHLQAASLGFRHPETNKRIRFRAMPVWLVP